MGGLALGQAAYALSTTTYSFVNVSNNNINNAAAGESQLRVDVIDIGSGRVAFKFYHVGSKQMSITDVYFDDGSLLGMASLSWNGNVDFSMGASPGDLPAGEDAYPRFDTTVEINQYFSADSNPATQPNGVNPGEDLTVTFNLLNGRTYAETLAFLDDPKWASVGSDGKAVDYSPSQDLRIGIHVQGFANGGSESFVNNGRVPDGGTTAIMLGLGALGLCLIPRQRA